MATPNQGTKFRRVSSNKDHSRVSTDDILTSSPPSYPDITAYDALMHSAATARPNTRSNNSNRHGGSFDHLLERQSDGEGAPVFSMTGTTSPDSFNQADYDPQAAVHSRSYAHHCRNSGGTRLRGDGSSRHQHRRHSLQYPPSQPPLPPLGHALSPHSSRELFSHSGREVESFTRLRDSMSQDTLEFDYHYRYNGNHSGTLPTLSLQDSHHGDHTRSSRNRERVINDRDLRRHHDVMPTHEAFSHRAILPATGAPVQLSYLSLNPASQESNSRGGDSTVIHHQPLASTVESQRSQSPPDNTQERPGSGVQLHSPLPHNYYPVFFSPESGRLFMSVDGNYKPLPNHVMDVPSIHTGAQAEQQQHLSVLLESSGRHTSSSYGMRAPYDYYHCSIVMMLLYILCLNIVAVLLCSIPALWFARKAIQAKYEGDYAMTLSLGTKALCFNIIGGFVHVLFLCAITFTPILLQFVFHV